MPAETPFLDLQRLLPQMASLGQHLQSLASGTLDGTTTSAASPQLEANYVPVHCDRFCNKISHGCTGLLCRDNASGNVKAHKPLRKPSLFCSHKALEAFTPEISVEEEKKVRDDSTAAASSCVGARITRGLGISAPTTTRQPARLRLYPGVPLPAECVHEWNTILMPRVNLALAEVYRKDPRSFEVSLEAIGPTKIQTKPTVLVICSAVKKVRAELLKKESSMFSPHTRYALKVCRGSLLRSRRDADQRSMASDNDAGELIAANDSFQERPMPGASIGAWIGDRHLPPVSYGGLVEVDGKRYGMTVHHMLDDLESGVPLRDAHRSIAARGDIDLFRRLADPAESDDGEHFTCEFSSSDSESEDDLDDEHEEFGDIGDIPGIEPGCGDGYIVTQPAIDDVEDGFFRSSDTQDEEHLDSFGLGEIYASSGIRRRNDDRGLIHEIDWTLFEFMDRRHSSTNASQMRSSSIKKSLTFVVPALSLPNLEVECLARTSGLQTGTIMPTLTSVRIYGRKSSSHTYQVTSKSGNSRMPLGLPGDSGAWVIERTGGGVCGHILAWSNRKRVAYICPMEMLLLDIAETLEAREIRLPGGEPIVHQMGGNTEGSVIDDLADLFDESEPDEIRLV